MTMTIALAGKGGTGKTTVAALLMRSLLLRAGGSLLAIDADPASNLHLALGLDAPQSIGDVREEMMEVSRAGQLGVSISRVDYLTREVRLALEEGNRVDLLAMGRPEGQGCYCAVNHLLRQVVDELSSKYDYVVIDNEAGMEHISRRTTRDVDLLLIVTDPTVRGLETARAIAAMAGDIEVNVHRTMLVVNRVVGTPPAPLRESVERLGVEIAAWIPADERVNEQDALGRPLIGLEADSPAVQAVDGIVTRVLGKD